ncbi:MAG: tRNA lysidine(34) synthetase TilS, partial [Halioglobus sp.]|nr:tRNA lysidine(34) synthetase TilS [Halioglobus sp.]
AAQEVLFMAHHLDDQVETFLLRLLRGAGLEGLAAMPAQRPLGAGTLVRPLLSCRRAELADYARVFGLSFVEDPSNTDTRFDRNFLRAEVLPLLAGRWPGYRATIVRAGEHLGAAALQLRELAGPLPLCTTTFGDPGLELPALLAGGEESAATRLRAALALWGARAPDHAALGEFLRQLRDAGEEASPELRTADCTLRRFQGGVFRVPGGLPPTDTFDLVPGTVLEVPGVGRIALAPTAGEGIVLAAGARLEVRFRTGGEYCRARGRAAAPLKKLLQEWGVPPWWRQRLPLLYCGEELVGIADMALCESSRLGAADGADQRWILTWERPDSSLDD